MENNDIISINAIIADDHEIIRRGIERMLAHDEKIHVVAMAADGEEAIRLVREMKPDILIADILMPKISGFDVVKQLKAENSPTKIVIASAFEDLDHIETAVQFGADGYLAKDISSDDLVNALHQVIEGKRVFSQTIVNVLNNNDLDNKENKDFVTISRREQEVLNLLAQGKTSNQIADELFISVRTVQVHRSNILKKLGIKNAAGLVRYAVLNFNKKA